MIRVAVVTLLVALVAYAAAWLGGDAVMPVYLATWLMLLAIPVGALPLVLGLELAGQDGGWESLRRLLVLMPAAALCGLPVLLRPSALYAWMSHPLPGFAGAWLTPLAFGLRGAGVLALWTLLCLAALRAPRSGPRVALCGVALALHSVLGTIAATDWVMSLCPGLNAAGFGLLVMAGQGGLALCVAVLLERAPPPFASGLLMAGACAWAVLHAVQYLVIWSADKPGEIVWYMQRANGLSVAAIWLGVAAVGAAALGGLGRRTLRAAAAVLLLAHLVEVFWLTTPSIRGAFVPGLADAAGVLTALAACAALSWAWRPGRVAT